MTLAAVADFNNLPFIIGDLLVSGESELALELPTKVSINSVFPLEGKSGYVPVALEQKLVIIDSNLAIAWSGRKFAARALLKEISELNQRQEFTGFTLKKFFDEKRSEGWENDDGYVALIRNGDEIHFAGFQCIGQLLDGTPRYLAAGTGAEDFAKAINTKSTSYFHAGYEPRVTALIECSSLLGKFLSNEVVHNDSLLNYYGGGFEMAFVTEDLRIEKFSDITYLIFQYIDPPLVPEGTYGMALRHVSKNFYKCDHLIIRSVRIHDPSATNTSEKLDIVAPFLTPASIFEGDLHMRDLPLQSSFYCLRFYLPTGNSFTCCVTNPSENDLNISQNENGVTVNLRNTWVDGLMKQGLDYLRNPTSAVISRH